MPEAKKARAVGLNHFALEVGDIEEALLFYSRIFEFQLRGKNEDMALIDLGDQFLALQKGRKQPPDDGRHFGLVVDDKDAVRQALAEAGVEVLPGPFLDFRDPWGNRFEIVGYDNIQFSKAPEAPRVRALTADETRTWVADRAWADISTDDEHYCEHVKDFRRACIGAAAVAYGEHLAATAGPTDEREAAYRASVDELTTAWKENPELGNAIHVATVLERTEPLKEYLASDKPLSPQNRLGLIAIIEQLEQRIASLKNKKVGRPQRKSDVWNAATAERNAALLVASYQAAWREENGRERVPPAETDDMINRAIAEAAKAFGVPVASIGKDNIRIALKAGRI